MAYEQGNVRPIWTGEAPLPCHFINFAETSLNGILGATTATIADFLDEMPAFARHLNRQRDEHNQPGPKYVSPDARIGKDVYLGSGCIVHEFSTVRDGSIVDADAIVGFGNEVVRSYLGPKSDTSHRNTVSASLVGADAHITTGVCLASTTFRNPDMRKPTKHVVVIMPDRSVYVTGTAKFGAIIGDGARIGANSVIGPGAIIGKNAIVGGLIHLPSGLYPADAYISKAAIEVQDSMEPQYHHLPKMD